MLGRVRTCMLTHSLLTNQLLVNESTVSTIAIDVGNQSELVILGEQSINTITTKRHMPWHGLDTAAG